MEITNRLGLPQALVDAVRNDSYNRGTSDITVTQLIGPPRIRILTEEFENEIIEDVSERLWALYGQAVHSILERASDNEVVEDRLYVTMYGKKIGGMYDNLRLKEKLLSDYKMTSVFAVKGQKPKPEWERQLNVLAYLAIENGLEVENLEIIGMLKDWRKAEARRDPEYPDVPIKRVPVKLWEKDSIRNYIKNRLLEHFSGQIPFCTDDERWANEPCVAVIRPGARKALRLFRGASAIDEAANFIRGHKDGKHLRIEPRPVRYNRCEDYCPVSKFCDQWSGHD